MSTTLPESHSSEGEGNKCPVNAHAFIPPKEGDSRAPCPALNTLANHGYLPHDGKNIAGWDIVSALQEVYALSFPLAAYLTYGGLLTLSKLGTRFDLHELAKHNKLEHDASLVHRDTPAGEEYAPIQVDPELVEALINDVRPTAEEVEAKKAKGENAAFLFGWEDGARARVRREKESRPIGQLHTRVARGELALPICLFGTTVGDKMGIPVEHLKTWIQEERLPEGWKPDHVQGIFETMKARSKIDELVNKMKEDELSSTETV